MNDDLEKLVDDMIWDCSKAVCQDDGTHDDRVSTTLCAAWIREHLYELIAAAITTDVQIEQTGPIEATITLTDNT